MKDIEHASINGVEIHNLAEQDSDENLLYSGELWLEGKPVGSFRELNEDEMQLDIAPEFEQTMNERIASYLQALTEDEEGEGGAVNEGELSSEIFFEDLIELELYLQAFKDGVTEGYGCLLVNYTDEGVDVFSVENEDEVENIARENNLTDFQTFYEPEHFIADRKKNPRAEEFFILRRGDFCVPSRPFFRGVFSRPPRCVAAPGAVSYRR